MTNWIEIARMRMDQASARRAKATTQADWDRADRILQSAASDLKEALNEAGV